jgi:hypothetical protein
MWELQAKNKNAVDMSRMLWTHTYLTAALAIVV